VASNFNFARKSEGLGVGDLPSAFRDKPREPPLTLQPLREICFVLKLIF
jgi:hypothetical protein